MKINNLRFVKLIMLFCAFTVGFMYPVLDTIITLKYEGTYRELTYYFYKYSADWIFAICCLIVYGFVQYDINKYKKREIMSKSKFEKREDLKEGERYKNKLEVISFLFELTNLPTDQVILASSYDSSGFKINNDGVISEVVIVDLETNIVTLLGPVDRFVQYANLIKEYETPEQPDEYKFQMSCNDEIYESEEPVISVRTAVEMLKVAFNSKE